MSTVRKTGNVIVWIILLLLILGLGGFGISNFGGSVLSVGRVGDTEITVDAYARALTQELRAAEAQFGAPVTLAQAQAFGLVDQARSRVITTTALDNEAARLGLSVGDEQVRKQVLSYDAFKGIDGTFDREAYRFTLEQNNLTEAGFEAQVRTETARTLLQGAVLSGSAAPAALTGLLYDYIAARRSYDYVLLTEADLTTAPGTPDEAALQSYHDANETLFTAPLTRAITYAWLTPDMLLDTVTVDDEALQHLYAERRSHYVRPERRLVERLVYPSYDEAEAARARLDAGEATFEDLVAERGLELGDIDLGDVTEDELGLAGTAVFALDGPGVVGPVQTDLGPALIRMNAVLAAQQTSFDEALPELREEIARDRARRLIGDRMSDFDDRLAAGATLEELAAETEMELGRIDYATGDDQGIAGYQAFREAADAVEEGDFPELAELEDGGVFAIRLDAVTPPRLKPLDEVRDEALAGWQAEEARRLLVAQAEDVRARLDEGQPMSTLGTVEQVSAVTRGGIAPAELAQTVFSLEPGESAVVDTADGVYLLQLTEALPPDPDAAEAAVLRAALEGQAAQGIDQDLFVYFTQALLDGAGLSLDQAAINAVHAQFP